VPTAKASEYFMNALAQLRAVRGAVAEFCRKTGFARNTVESWIDGVAFPSLEKLDRIAEALEVPVDSLIAPPKEERDRISIEEMTKELEATSARLKEENARIFQLLQTQQQVMLQAREAAESFKSRVKQSPNPAEDLRDLVLKYIPREVIDAFVAARNDDERDTLLRAVRRAVKINSELAAEIEAGRQSQPNPSRKKKAR
jgi:transcriptional regulator with XRE-family HTH domain